MARAWSGSGTANSPIQLSTDADWQTLHDQLAGGNTFEGKYLEMTADITATQCVGTVDYPFKGVFNGNNHTLTVNLSSTEADIVAPFLYVTSASIKNLTVAGTISCAKRFGGLTGYNRQDNNIGNCTVKATLTTQKVGDSSCGGFTAHIATGTTTYSSCAFIGSLAGNKSHSMGGFVGWLNNSNGAKAVVTDCLFHPAEISEVANSYSATFVRSGDFAGAVTVNGSCYVRNIGEEQGQQVLAQSPDIGLYKVFSVAGQEVYVTAQVTNVGTMQNYEEGQSVPVNPVVTCQGETLVKDADYTVSLLRNGNAVNSIDQKGVYKVIVASNRTPYQGAWTTQISVGQDVAYRSYSEGTYINNVRESYYVVSAETESLAEGWYVVSGEVTINRRLNASGDVRLILTDGSTLTVNGGIHVGGSNQLTIYGQKDDTGALTIASVPDNAAGIGGDLNEDSGIITIHGGTVSATGGVCGAAIGGGGRCGNGSNITIHGGNITATSGYLGAAIGGGAAAYITRTSESYYYIGSMNHGGAGVITINGGTVNATATRPDAAAIGGGSWADTWGILGEATGGDGGTIIINGGQITATAEGIYSIGAGGRANYYGNRMDGAKGVIRLNLSKATDFVMVNKNMRGNIELQKLAVIEGSKVLPTESNAVGKKIVASTGIFSGEGTNVSPWIVADATDWDNIGLLVKTSSLADDKYFKQTADIAVTTMIGSSTNPFCGHYNGDGHTLTVSYDHTGTAAVAPFSYVKDVYISDLHVAGTIKGGLYTSGLVGDMLNGAEAYNWIDNCRVSASVTGSGSDEVAARCGGVVGNAHTSKLNVTGCLFDGTLATATEADGTAAGAIVGWAENIANITVLHCVERGTIGNFSRKGINLYESDGIQVFNGDDSYCTSDINGRLAHRIASGTEGLTLQYVTPTRTYSVSGINIYYLSGFSLGDDRYAGYDEKVVFKVIAPADLAAYEVRANGEAMTADSDGFYTLTVGISDVTITAVNDCPTIVLADDADNAATLARYNGDGKTYTVKLAGRTLYKDGNWNTLCLPFDVDYFDGTPFEGATVKTLSSSKFSNGTLTLNFSDANAIKAGMPFIVKWAVGDDVVNPEFENVTIKGDSNTSTATDAVTFQGIYSPLSIAAEDNTMLYMGAGNTLYYPNGEMAIGAFRAYFRLNEGITGGDLTSARGAKIVLNFDDEEATAIENLNPAHASEGEGSWFTLDGRRINGKPSQRGIYINNGKRIVIK
ncbi:MAG: hypothetical protein IJ163_02600 [Bacteroidaceae bacterium]|nr:hypothetical protein [Bacteroidaceae bacterium]